MKIKQKYDELKSQNFPYCGVIVRNVQGMRNKYKTTEMTVRQQNISKHNTDNLAF